MSTPPPPPLITPLMTPPPMTPATVERPLEKVSLNVYTKIQRKYRKMRPDISSMVLSTIEERRDYDFCSKGTGIDITNLNEVMTKMVGQRRRLSSTDLQKLLKQVNMVKTTYLKVISIASHLDYMLNNDKENVKYEDFLDFKNEVEIFICKKNKTVNIKENE